MMSFFTPVQKDRLPRSIKWLHRNSGATIPKAVYKKTQNSKHLDDQRKKSTQKPTQDSFGFRWISLDIIECNAIDEEEEYMGMAHGIYHRNLCRRHSCRLSKNKGSF